MLKRDICKIRIDMFNHAKYLHSATCLTSDNVSEPDPPAGECEHSGQIEAVIKSNVCVLISCFHVLQ